MKNYYVYLINADDSDTRDHKILSIVLFVKGNSSKNSVSKAQDWLNNNDYPHLIALDASFAITEEFPEFSFINRVTETVCDTI